MFLGSCIAYVSYLIPASQEHEAPGAFLSVMLFFFLPLTVITLLVMKTRRFARR